MRSFPGVSLQEKEAEYGFSGFITTNKQKKQTNKASNRWPRTDPPELRGRSVLTTFNTICHAASVPLSCVSMAAWGGDITYVPAIFWHQSSKLTPWVSLHVSPQTPRRPYSRTFRTRRGCCPVPTFLLSFRTDTENIQKKKHTMRDYNSMT